MGSFGVSVESIFAERGTPGFSTSTSTKRGKAGEDASALPFKRLVRYLSAQWGPIIDLSYADGLSTCILSWRLNDAQVVPSKDPEYLSIVLVIGPLNPWEEAWPSELPHTTYTWPKL